MPRHYCKPTIPQNYWDQIPLLSLSMLGLSIKIKIKNIKIKPSTSKRPPYITTIHYNACFRNTSNGGLLITPILLPRPIAITKMVITGKSTKNGQIEGKNGVSKTIHANSWLLIKDSTIPDIAPSAPR